MITVITITTDQLERIKKLPPPGVNTFVPLDLVPAYLAYHKIQADKDHKVPINKPIQLHTTRAV